MENVNIQVKDGKAIIVIDLAREGQRSKSGKSVVIATTRGNVSLPGASDYKLGLNLYK